MARQIQRNITMRSSSRFFLRSAGVFLLFSLGVIANGNAAELECNQYLTPSAFSKMGEKRRRTIQRNLFLVYQDNNEYRKDYQNSKYLSDGLIGTVTLRWLKHFCTDLAIDTVPSDSKNLTTSFPLEVIETLSHFAAIAREYPNWKEILLSWEFNQWIGSQPKPRQTEIDQIRRIGTAQQIIALINSFLLSHGTDTMVTQLKSKDDFWVSYRLSEAVIKKLQEENSVIVQLSKLQDKPFPDKQQLWLEVQDKIKDITSQTDNYRFVTEQNAKEKITFQLTDKSFEVLKLKNIPDEVLGPLEKLKDLPFNDKAQIKFAIEQRFLQLKEQGKQKEDADQRSPEETTIKSNQGKTTPDAKADTTAVKNDSLQLSIDKLKEAESQKVLDAPNAEDVLQLLGEKIGRNPGNIRLEFDALAQLKEEDIQRILNAPDTLEELNKIIAQQNELQKKQQEKEMQEQEEQNKEDENQSASSEEVAKSQIAEPLTKNLLQEILAASELIKTYQLTEQSLDNINAGIDEQEIPQVILGLAMTLIDVEFARKDLFSSALTAKLETLRQQNKDLIISQARIQDTLGVTDEFIVQLKKEGISDALLEQIGLLKNRKFNSQNAFATELIKLIYKIFIYYEKFIPAMTVLAKQDHKSYQLQEIKWNEGACGCVLDNLSGEVYGFYPFWHATGEEQIPEFSVMTRIGYYAVSFDKKGEIIDLMHWRSSDAEFINTAWHYRTDVDLIVYKHWEEFAEQVKNNEMLIDEATTNLVNVVNKKLSNSLFNVLKPYISFGARAVPTMGDGITLYFDGYPVDKETNNLFIEFVKKLRAKLKQAYKGFKLNILMPMESIQHNVFTQDYLFKFIPEVGENQANYEEQNQVDLFLIFLREPTATTKKQLRQEIENIFNDNNAETEDIRSMQRRNMLRKIVPIITYNDQKEQQLTADITYFEDNFGGVGLWPMISRKVGNNGESANVKEQEIVSVIRNNFIIGQNGNDYPGNFLLHFMDSGLNGLQSSLGNFVCEHRWLFRILFNMLLISLLIFGYLYYFKCYRRCFLALLGLLTFFVINFLLLLFFDPAYNEVAKGNGVLIFLILVIMTYLIRNYFIKQKQLP